MDIAIRPALLSEDRHQLTELLENNFPPLLTHFRWRHEENPAGPGWTWVIYDRKSGAIGAMASLTPRNMYLNGKPVLCGQVCEFVVDKSYRSLGPALMLQRATFEPVDSGALDFCYDCPPHDEGMSTFVRLGMRSTCEVKRYALALRSDEVLSRKLGSGAWARPVIAGANLLLRMSRPSHRAPELEVSNLHGSFDEQFTAIDKAVPSSGIIRASRSAQLLNWRYRSRSDVTYEVIVARRRGELLAFLAYIVYEETEGLKRALIADLFGLDLAETGPALLQATIEACRKMNLVCLEAYCTETNSLKPLFEATGFRARERTARIVTYTKAGKSSGNGMSLGVSWPVGHVEITL
jgi:Acetyltransferase (GNAT) domain